MISEDKIDDVYKLVAKFCQKYNIYSEETIQDLTARVWEKLDKLYDETKSKLSTYVFLCCKHFYFMDKRKKLPTIISLHTVVEDGCELIDTVKNDWSDPLEELIHQEELKKLDKIYNNCSYVLKCYLNGERQVEIAKKIGCSQSQISRRIKKELNKIRKELK